MKKEKIVFVVQRYGLDVNGGSEYECREIAEHMLALYDVDVYTTSSRGYSPWDNYYGEGISQINGVTVYRFGIDETKPQVEGMDNEQQQLAGLMPRCPKLLQTLKEHAKEYKVVFFQTYVFYTTVMGMRLGLDHSILVPTAHDEPMIYNKIYYDTISKAKGILYNSIEEKEFLVDKFNTGNIPGRTTCVGLKKVGEQNWSLPEKYAQYQNYVIYVGRVCTKKKLPLLHQYFTKYKEKNPSDLKLLVLGRADKNVKITQNEDVVFLGYVSEEEKKIIMKNARFLILPSMYESLSLVILESMQLGRPVLVNGECAVLKGQCIRSNAGLYYTNYAEFEKCMDFLLNDEECYQQMAQNGIEFVKKNYNWDVVVENINSLIEEVAQRKEES